MFRRSLLVLFGASLGAAAGLAFAAPSARERALIDRLIGFVEQQRGAAFIRNGTEHSCADAAKFLRGKMDSMGDDVHTAREFVDRIASKSSTTGEAYRVKFDDGRTITASKYLLDELARLERPR